MTTTTTALKASRTTTLTCRPPPLYVPPAPIPWGVLLSDGRLGVVVPLVGKHGKGLAMELDELDWARVCLTHGHRWTVRWSGKRHRYVVGTGKHDGVPLARVIVRAQGGQTVAFRDGDPFNLARGNLEVLRTGEATRRAFGR